MLLPALCMCRSNQNFLASFSGKTKSGAKRVCNFQHIFCPHSPGISDYLWLVWEAVQQTGSLMGGLEFLWIAWKKEIEIAGSPEWCFSSHQSSPSSGKKPILCMTIWAAGHAPSVKAEGSRQFLSCSLCNNKAYRGLGRCRRVKWITGQWQRRGYFLSFFWEDVGG